LGRAGLGTDQVAIEALVNDVSGHRASIYNRATYWPERVAAAQAWADVLVGPVGEREAA
jgi:hypothetical protein